MSGVHALLLYIAAAIIVIGVVGVVVVVVIIVVRIVAVAYPGAEPEAVSAAGDAIESVPGEDGQTYLELADPPTGGNAEPGLRLLPEFDGLLLGFAGSGRSRFCSPEELVQIWAKVNGLFAPVVLQDDRLVATWRTLTRGRRTDLEVTMLGGRRALAEDRLSDPVQAVESVLGLSITDIRVGPLTH